MPGSRTQRIDAPLLWRLIDREPGNIKEASRSSEISLDQYKRMVSRDLENLLNTKCSIQEVPETLREVNNSLFVYGLKDFTSKSPKSPSVRNELRNDIGRAIMLFEPRLKNITISIENDPNDSRTIKIRIAGFLVFEDISEPVTFDTYFDINRGEYRVGRS